MLLTDTPLVPVVISLVLRLHEEGAEAVVAKLRSRSEIEVGQLRDVWLPVVAETPEPQKLHAWLESLPGVAFVDVTFVEVVPAPESLPCSGDFSLEPDLK